MSSLPSWPRIALPPMQEDRREVLIMTQARQSRQMACLVVAAAALLAASQIAMAQIYVRIV